MVKIILCDLNMTLSANMKQVTGRSLTSGMDKAITDVEQYRSDLVRWLKGAQAHGWEVHLFTVRRTVWEDATLANIQRRTGWLPDRAHFNDTGIGGQDAHRVKAILLRRVLDRFHPTHLYALESSNRVHQMFRKAGVPCQRGDTPLPSYADLDRVGSRDDPTREEPQV